MTDTSRLIFELTHTHDVPVHQHGRHLGTRTRRPLLDTLADARVSSLGRGGETRPARERVQLNIAATELHDAITTTLRQWVRADGYRPPTTGWPPTRTLLTFHATYTRNTRPPHHDDTITTWHTAITDLLIDPPRRWTLNTPCPQCGARWATTGDDRVDALTVHERDPIDATTITCRNCTHTWPGLHGARTLAHHTQGAA